MRCARWVLLALLIGFGLLSPPLAVGQESRAPPAAPTVRAFRLEQNNPNPVYRETWIPFHLEDVDTDGTPRIVTIRIFNVLRQLVAVPTAVGHPRGKEVKVLDLPYGDGGRKVAYWDGKDTAGRYAPTGVYYCELVVDGEVQIGKITVVNQRRRNLIPWFGKKTDRPE